MQEPFEKYDINLLRVEPYISHIERDDLDLYRRGQCDYHTHLPNVYS